MSTISPLKPVVVDGQRDVLEHAYRIDVHANNVPRPCRIPAPTRYVDLPLVDVRGQEVRSGITGVHGVGGCRREVGIGILPDTEANRTRHAVGGYKGPPVEFHVERHFDILKNAGQCGPATVPGEVQDRGLAVRGAGLALNTRCSLQSGRPLEALDSGRTREAGGTLGTCGSGGPLYAGYALRTGLPLRASRSGRTLNARRSLGPGLALGPYGARRSL